MLHIEHTLDIPPIGELPANNGGTAHLLSLLEIVLSLLPLLLRNELLK